VTESNAVAADCWQWPGKYVSPGILLAKQVGKAESSFSSKSHPDERILDHHHFICSKKVQRQETTVGEQDQQGSLSS